MSRSGLWQLFRTAGLVIALSGGVVLGQAPEELFNQGNEAYARGDYGGAVQAYETLLAYRMQDPRLEYNLGNALFKLGRLGPAILHYERARRLKPTDREILANLEYARSFCLDQVPGARRPALIAWMMRLQDGIGPDRQAWAVVLGVWSIAILLGWALARPGRFSAAHGWVLAGVLLVTTLTAMSWWTTFQRLDGQRQAVVLSDTVEVLAGPGQNNATLFTIHEGLTVAVRGERPEWVQVSLPNGLNGWLSADAVELI